MGFIVDNGFKVDDLFCGLKVYETGHLPECFSKENDLIFVAMQWDGLNSNRKKVYERLKSIGYRFANIISPNAIIHSEIKGDNCWICDYVIIENDVEIGNNVFIKSKATILHCSNIRNHSFIGANSLIAGSCNVGEQSYVGISSTIFNRVNIGKKCLVGACTYVKRNLPDYTIIKTPNDEFIQIQSSEEEIETKLLASVKIR